MLYSLGFSGGHYSAGHTTTRTNLKLSIRVIATHNKEDNHDHMGTELGWVTRVLNVPSHTPLRVCHNTSLLLLRSSPPITPTGTFWCRCDAGNLVRPRVLSLALMGTCWYPTPKISGYKYWQWRVLHYVPLALKAPTQASSNSLAQLLSKKMSTEVH